MRLKVPILAIRRSNQRWQIPEYYEALDRRVKSPDFPVVLMLLEGQTAPGLPFLRQLHWIVTPDPACEKDVARLFDAAAGSSGGSRPGELWRYTSPYRGLTAMEEKDSDYFFGRKRETLEVLSVLAEPSNSLPILLGNSGVGKSSVAQAGVLAALKRQAWPADAGAPAAWPPAFRGSRQWCFLTLKPGAEPLRALVEPFLQTWHLDATDPIWEERRAGWIDRLLEGKATLPGLLDATERRYTELGQPHPPAFFLYVDQGEELYVRAEERQQRRFSEVLAAALTDPRLHVMMSMRSDFLGHLQNDAPLFNARRQIDVPPLREAELREVVSRPAELLSTRFETESLIDVITRRTVEDSIKDVGALPLLSYTLEDMWKEMVRRGDGTLRLPAQSFELGGVLVLPLVNARSWLARRAGDINEVDCKFILRSRSRQQRRRVQALASVLAVSTVGSLTAWMGKDELNKAWRWWAVTGPFMQANVRPYVLAQEAERALKTGGSFRECAADKDYCPEMIVVPAGKFMMGSAGQEPGHEGKEEPQHEVSIAQRFAASRFDITFEEWDACAEYGADDDCLLDVADEGWGRGRRPVINVSWTDAQYYLGWLSRMTGKHYRLLTEAEWEYVARAGTTTPYYWGDEIGKGNATCNGCGSQWDNKQTSPVGSFKPNAFGLYDMAGNVWQWVEDCYHPNYDGAPTDGSAWATRNCNNHVVRGGALRRNPIVS
jgi:formylglycine-generating enzyme required for sulfatase activity